MKPALLLLQAALLYLLLRNCRRVVLPWATAYFALSLAAAIPYGAETGWWWAYVRPATEPALIVLRCIATVEALRPLLRGLGRWYRRELVAALVGLAAGLAWAIWAIGELPRDWGAAVQDARSATYVGLSCAALFVQVFGEGRGFARAHAVLWSVLLCWHGVLELGWQMDWLRYPQWWWGETSAYIVAIACVAGWIIVVWKTGHPNCMGMARVASA